MSILWLTPAALWGLALIAGPVAIHLLVRQQTRRVEYPSLRFLRSSQLAAFRRRSIQDALLLLCRSAIVMAAVLALAGPVLQTAARTAAYAERVARAVIVEPGVAPSAAGEVAGNAFASRSFARADLGDAIADATRWLNEQPPAAREIVFAGALRRGRISAGQLSAIPSLVGIRFVTTQGLPASQDMTLPVLRAGSDGALVMIPQQVRLSAEETRVVEGGATPALPDQVRIIAAPADQPVADAALRAALTAGLRWSEPSSRVLVVWSGADEVAVRAMQQGATAVRMERPTPVSSSASAVVAAIEQMTASSTTSLEPVRITRDQLEAWSRPPGAVPADTRPVDEGDRRWFWGLALALLGLEQVMRRTRASTAAVPATDVEVRADGRP